MGCIYKPKYTDRNGNRCESKTHHIKYYVNGKPMYESTHTTDYNEAKQILKRREGEVAGGKPILPGQHSIKFSVLGDGVKRDYKINDRRSARDVESRLRLHILPEIGNMKASAINTATIRLFIDKRQQEGASNAEVNRELAIIKRAFSLAIEGGQITLNKPFIPMLKESSARQGFFEPAQFLALVNHLPGPVQPVAEFGYLTGWRKSEVLTLQWRQVDFDARTVRLYTSKNDEGRVFPFTPDLESLLLRQKGKAEQLLKLEKPVITPWVFHHNGGKPIREFKRSWKTACKKAGVPGRLFHDLRRTAVRNLERAGVPRTIAMKLTGHKTESIYRRYDIVSPNDLQVAAQLLGNFTGGLLSERQR